MDKPIMNIDELDTLARSASTDSTVVSEDVQAAIEELNSGMECTDMVTDEEYVEAHISKKSLDLAITALRQMKGEPK